jgi:low affinity Fe/Cu permease
VIPRKDLAWDHYIHQQDTISTTQGITKNTSDPVLFITMVVLIQNVADMEYI